MGVVVHALDMTGGKAVALKVLRRDASDRDRERFALEARAVARLNHPNIVPIHEVGDVDGRPFLAMAFVEGRSLRSELEHRPEGRLDAETIRDLGIQLCDALETSHRAGVLHRDLKPDNILLAAENDRPILVDFGLAQGHAEADSDTSLDGERLTRDGEYVGTPLYMAPEQFDKDAWGDTGPATDVWGLAATLYHAAGGRPPFQASSALMIMAAQLNDPPPALTSIDPTIPPWLDRLLRACLRPNPADRPSITELHDGFLARRARPGASARRLRRALVMPAALALLAALIGGAALSYQSHQRSLPVLLARARAAEVPAPETLARLAAATAELDRDALAGLKPLLLRLSRSGLSMDEARRPHCRILHRALVETTLAAAPESAGSASAPAADEALATAEELLELRPLDGPSLRALTPLLLRPEHRRDLQTLADEGALESVPEPERARLEGRAAHLSADIERAFMAFDRGLAAAPKSIPLLDQAARLAFFCRQDSRARRLLTQRLKLKPFDPALASLQLRLLTRQGDPEQVRRARVQLAIWEREHPDATWAIERAALEAFRPIWPPVRRLPPPPPAVARSWEDEREHAKLIDDGVLRDELVARMRLYQTRPEQLGRNLTLEARRLVSFGEFEAAAELLDEALRDLAGWDPATRRGLKLVRAGVETARVKDARAKAMVEAARAGVPDDRMAPENVSLLAHMLEALDRPDEAIRLIEQRFGPTPEHPARALDLAGLQTRLAVNRVNESRGDHGERPRIEADAATMALVASARRILDARLAAEPRDVAAISLKISTLVFENRFDDAITLGQRSLSFGYGSAALRMAIMNTLVFSRQPSERITRHLRESLLCLPSDPGLNNWAARRRFEAGLTDEALGPARIAFRRFTRDERLARCVLAGASRTTARENLPALVQILRTLARTPPLIASASGLLDVHLGDPALDVPPERAREIREQIIASCMIARDELIRTKTNGPEDLATILAIRAAMQDTALGRKAVAGHRLAKALRRRLPSQAETRKLAATHLVDLGRPDAAGAVLLARLDKVRFPRGVRSGLINRAWKISLEAYLPLLTLRAFEEAARIRVRDHSLTITAIRSAKILGQHGLAAELSELIRRERPLDPSTAYLRCLHAFVVPDEEAARASVYAMRLLFRSSESTAAMSIAVLGDDLDPDVRQQESLLLREVIRSSLAALKRDASQRLELFGQRELGGRRLELIGRIEFDSPRVLAGLVMLRAGWTPGGTFRVGPADPRSARELLGPALSLAPSALPLLVAELFLTDAESPQLKARCERILEHPRAGAEACAQALMRLGRHGEALNRLGYQPGGPPPKSIKRGLTIAAVLADAGRHEEELELLITLRRQYPVYAVVAARLARALATAARRRSPRDEAALRRALDACAAALEITPSLHGVPGLAVELALQLPPCEEIIRAGSAVRRCLFQPYDCRVLEALGTHAAGLAVPTAALQRQLLEAWPQGRWNARLRERLARPARRD